MILKTHSIKFKDSYLESTTIEENQPDHATINSDSKASKTVDGNETTFNTIKERATNDNFQNTKNTYGNRRT